MPLSRRDFLKLGGLTASAAALSSCSVVGRELAQHELPETLALPTAAPAGTPTTASDPVVRLLNRAGYGPRPGDVQRATAMGLAAYLEEQLNPEAIDDAPAGLIVRSLSYYNMDISQLYASDEPLEAARDLGVATISRALYSRRQLSEAMVEFWSDHFNIYLRKSQFMPFLKIIDDREVIRPHALGKFHDLLSAVAHSPAMLVYLDNTRNVQEQPNENYARELLELHTLGVDGGYTQQDVQEVARALTGWGVQRRGPRGGQFRFFTEAHDTGQKQVLGRTLPAGRGAEDVTDVLTILAEHPATAHFVAGKLVRRFVADAPPAGLVERVAQTYQESDGDIKAMLRTIFLSEAFATAPPKLKRPYSFMLSAMRALNANATAAESGLGRWLNMLGQPLFQWPPPNGYPDVAAAWAANLLPRWNFSLALVSGRMPGVETSLQTLTDAAPAGAIGNVQEALHFFAGLILHQPLPAADEALFLDYIGSGPLTRPETRLRLAESVALMLASPAFQWM